MPRVARQRREYRVGSRAHGFAGFLGVGISSRVSEVCDPARHRGLPCLSLVSLDRNCSVTRRLRVSRTGRHARRRCHRRFRSTDVGVGTPGADGVGRCPGRRRRDLPAVGHGPDGDRRDPARRRGCTRWPPTSRRGLTIESERSRKLAGAVILRVGTTGPSRATVVRSERTLGPGRVSCPCRRRGGR